MFEDNNNEVQLTGLGAVALVVVTGLATYGAIKLYEKHAKKKIEKRIKEVVTEVTGTLGAKNPAA